MLQSVNGPMPSRIGFAVTEQRAIQSAIVDCNLDQIARVVRFPQWLEYIGVVLAYTEGAELKDLEITRALGPQLLRLVCY
jgi:hypothetical protein